MLKYILSIETLKKNLHLQVMARLRPGRLNLPDGWIPRNQIDKFVARNLIMDMPIGGIIKKFPDFSVSFVKQCIEA